MTSAGAKLEPLLYKSRASVDASTLRVSAVATPSELEELLRQVSEWSHHR